MTDDATYRAAIQRATNAERERDELKQRVTEMETMVNAGMPQGFEDWFCKNYPGPNTIIHSPKWHAPKIYRAAVYAMLAARKEQS